MYTLLICYAAFDFLLRRYVQLRSLKYVLLPDSSSDPTAMRGGSSYTVARAQKNRRTYFLALYAFLIQMLFMWILSREESAVKTVTNKINGSKA